MHRPGTFEQHKGTIHDAEQRRTVHGNLVDRRTHNDVRIGQHSVRLVHRLSTTYVILTKWYQRVIPTRLYQRRTGTGHCESMALAGTAVVEGEPWTLEHLFYGARAEDEMPDAEDVRRLLGEYYELWCMRDVTPQTVAPRVFRVLRITDDRAGLTWRVIHNQFRQDFIRWRKLERWATAHGIRTEGDVRHRLIEIQQVYKMVRRFLVANNTICARMRHGIPGAADVLPEEERNFDIVTATIDLPRLRTTSTTPTTVHERWRAMMKEGTFGDVVIVCSDGEEIMAHACVLTHASDYFRRIFEGLWNKNGSVRVNVPVEAMRALLSYLYLGEIDTDVIARYPASFLRLSQQYVLPDLKAVVDEQLARDADIDRLNELLILADKYDARRLMDACHTLVRDNPEAVVRLLKKARVAV